MSVLAFEHVTYRYPGRSEPSLRDVSVAFTPGELCVVTGPSGGGKSTLIRAASGLAPHFHGGELAGRVTVAGHDTREQRPAEIGLHAGTVLQDPESQVVMGTVRAELALPLESRGTGGAALARAVEEAALALGIAHLLDRRTGTLSAGELQRVSLAAALAPRPQLILLDEPTAHLDPVAGDELIWQLHRLNQEWETTVVLVEHRLERCLAAADRVLVLDGGRITCDADPPGFLRWAGEHAPTLQTPAAQLFAAAGLRPLPAGVRQARASLRAAGLLPRGAGAPPSPPPGRARGQSPLRGDGGRALRGGPRRRCCLMRGVWHELRDGPAILRGVDLQLHGGEAVALMGRNGAGKSTLLRHAAGLLAPTRGSVQAAGRVALVLQNPNDYLLHDRVGDEAPAAALEAVGLGDLADRHPRDLSGGERQRLALAIVLGERLSGAASSEPGTVLALDEPTRGMDRAAKHQLAGWLSARAQEGMAVIVATHDIELAAELSTRVLLMADGQVIADGPPHELLCRRLVLRDRDRPHPWRARDPARRGRRAAARRGARARADTGTAGRPAPGRHGCSSVCGACGGRRGSGGRAHGGGHAHVSWQLASLLIVLGSLGACGWWYERSRPSSKLVALVATLAALAALGRDAFAAIPDVKPITAIVLIGGIALGSGPGFAIGALGALASNLALGQGPWTPWQMLGWGLVGVAGGVLGALTGRRLGRVSLALAAACAAELFNLLLDLYTWTAAGNHSPAAFGAVLAAAAAFDITHVVASFAFAFAFGPALLAMLVRVRARLVVSWITLPPAPAAPAPPSRRRCCRRRCCRRWC